MARGTGCAFSFEEDGVSYKVSITLDSEIQLHANSKLPDKQYPEFFDGPLQTSAGTKDTSRGPVVLVTSNCMGKGSEELGQLLIKGFIFSLTQLNLHPEAVLFLNSGVHLTMEGANTVPDLKTLEEKGTKVYSCGTCVSYYKTTLAVGSIVDMMTITDHLASVPKGTAASGIITV
jgi:selenium metabolism protein YedF